MKGDAAMKREPGQKSVIGAPIVKGTDTSSPHGTEKVRKQEIDWSILLFYMGAGALMLQGIVLSWNTDSWWVAVSSGIIRGIYLTILATLFGFLLSSFGTTLHEIAIGSVIAMVGMLILFPAFDKARENARQKVCSSNLKRIGLASLQYASDHDDCFPPAATWADATLSYVPEKERADVLHCPTAKEGGYAWYDAASGAKPAWSKESAATLPLVYDSTATGRNAHDTGTSLPKRRRHPGGNNVLYSDGRAGHIKDGEPLIAAQTK